MVATDGETGTGYGQDQQKKTVQYMGKKNVSSAQMLEVSLSGVGAVLRLERLCKVNFQVTCVGQATNEYPRSPPTRSLVHR